MTVLKLTCCESQRSAWSCWIWDLCCPAQHVAQYCCLVALGSAPRPAEGHVQTRPLSPPALAPQPWNKEKMILSVSNSDLTTFLFLIHTYSKYFKMSCFLSQRALNFYTLPQNLQKYQYNEIWSENCLYIIKQTYKQLSMTVVNIMLRWQQIHYRFQWSCKKKINVVFKIRKCITNLCAAQIGFNVPLIGNWVTSEARKSDSEVSNLTRWSSGWSSCCPS